MCYKIKKIMLLSAVQLSLCVVVNASIANAGGGDDGVVRVPIVTHTREETESIRHLNHARRLLVEAQREIKTARMLKDWPDRDWAHMRRAVSGYAKSLELFIYPAYHPAPYREVEKSETSDVLSASLSKVDVYPNGEDVVSNR